MYVCVCMCVSLLSKFIPLRIYGPAAGISDLRTYANSEDSDQPGHPRSLVRIIAVRLHNE